MNKFGRVSLVAVALSLTAFGAQAENVTLKDAQSLRAVTLSMGGEESESLRLSALKETAKAYGMQAGLAFRTDQIQAAIKKNARNLKNAFSFDPLILPLNTHVRVIPPVISQSRDTFEQIEPGMTIRIADEYYEIIHPARLVSSTPLWQSYLERHYESPEEPDNALLPTNNEEQRLWANSVADGWSDGIAQADAIYETDMAELERDYVGMVTFKRLLVEGRVAAPVVATANQGVTGNGQHMRINDRAVRITAPAALVTDAREWDAPVSGKDPRRSAIAPQGEGAEPYSPRRPSAHRPGSMKSEDFVAYPNKGDMFDDRVPTAVPAGTVTSEPAPSGAGRSQNDKSRRYF